MSKCPVCKSHTLVPSTLESSLPVLSCSSCGGIWIRANEYALWLKAQTPGSYDLAKLAGAAQADPVLERSTIGICPDCNRFLRSYRVSSNAQFTLDRCGNCNGVWLDRNEWELLKSADLHDEIHRVFTQPWQQRIDAEVTAAGLEAGYLDRFGETDYARIKEIRNWLQDHPKRSQLLAFLMEADPYSL